jgi:hypothetical protein
MNYTHDFSAQKNTNLFLIFIAMFRRIRCILYMTFTAIFSAMKCIWYMIFTTVSVFNAENVFMHDFLYHVQNNEICLHIIFITMFRTTKHVYTFSLPCSEQRNMFARYSHYHAQNNEICLHIFITMFRAKKHVYTLFSLPRSKQWNMFTHFYYHVQFNKMFPSEWFPLSSSVQQNALCIIFTTLSKGMWGLYWLILWLRDLNRGNGHAIWLQRLVLGTIFLHAID